MSKQQQIVWAIIVVIVLAGLYWWWSSAQSASMTTDQPAATTQTSALPTTDATTPTNTNTSATTPTTPTSAPTSAPMSATVTYNGSSFSPASVTIAQGGTITWTSTAGNIWIASNPHPIHNGYDGTTMQQHCAPGYTGAAPLDECASATSWSFVFNKVGTWGYHDHLNASVKGSVTVVAQ
jgi:plastocyanin